MNRGILVAGCIIATALTACQQRPIHPGQMVDQAPRVGLAGGMESRDELDLSFLKVAQGSDVQLRALADVGLLNAGATAVGATVTPTKHLGSLNTPQHFSGGAHVGTAELSSGSIPSLHLIDGEPNELWLYYDAGTWYALVDKEPARRLVVHRYTYAGLDDGADYPATARFDWIQVGDVRRLVIGIRCGLAWCLLGAPARYEGADPDDPDPQGRIAPRYRRVRGWFDRAPIKDSKSYDWIYPTENTAKASTDEDFNDEWLHLFSIRTGPNNVVWGDEPFFVKRTRGKLFFNRNWKAQPTPGLGKKVDVTHVHLEETMPAAARWGRTYATRSSKGGPTTANARAARSMEAWVRCASGCCSATLTDE